jgi:hypothetical protein
MTTLTEVAAKKSKPKKAPKPAAGTKNRKPVTGNKKPVALVPRTKTNYAKVKEMFEAGKSYTEIAKACGLYNNDPKAVYPEARVANALTALQKGVMVDGKVIKVERGKRVAAKKKAA